MPKKLMLIIAGICGGVIIGSLVLEGICRHYGLGMLQRSDHACGLRFMAGRYRPAKNLFLGWEINPEQYRGNQVGFKSNSWGMPDREYPLEKPRGTCRIMVLGDSITEHGWYVKELERLLNASGLPAKFEVMNCGVAGYGAPQYYYNLLEKAALFHPDLVIVGFCLNDFDQVPVVTVDDQGRFMAYTNQIEDKFSGQLLKISPRLFFVSYAYRYMAGALANARFLADKNRTAARAAAETMRGRRALSEIADYARRNHMGLAGVIIPFLNSSYNSMQERQHRQLRDALQTIGWNYADLHGAFENIDDLSWRWVTTDNIHPSEKGHRVIANKIFEYLNAHPELLRPGGVGR